MSYESVLERLLARGVGLWDIIETAQRPGSLDSAIKNAEVRDLPDLAASLPDKPWLSTAPSPPKSA